MTSTLKNKAVSATIWSAIDIFARQIVNFGITLILARLLTPVDYGTVGLLSIFIGVATVFINSGFTSALVQRQEVSDVDLSSVFYFNIFAALIISILLCFAAPWISSFYNLPILTPLTRLMAITLFIGSLGSIQSTLLTKELNFRRQCAISLVSVVLSGVSAIVLAWHGYGVWSLAFSTLIATCATTILLWILNSWRPSLSFSFNSIRQLFRFGSYLLFSGLLDTIFSRMNTLFIGKFYSARDLGYYSRADGTQQLPTGLLAGIIGRVAFPIFAAAHQDKELLRSGLRKAITTIMMLNIPMMFGMAVTARPLVFVIFGEQWLPCVPYLQILCLGGIFWPLHVLNLNVLIAQGHSNLFFRLEVIKKVIGIGILGSACFFGIIAIAWSTVATGLICFVLNARYSGLILNYGTIYQSIDLLPYFGASLVMVMSVMTVTLLPLHSPLLIFTTQIFIGISVYFLICYFFRLSAFVEFFKVIELRIRLSD